MNDVLRVAQFVSGGAGIQTQFCLIPNAKLVTHETLNVLSSKPKLF